MEDDSHAQYLSFIRKAFTEEKRTLAQELADWRAHPSYSSLFGYTSPGWPVAMGAVCAFLYQEEGTSSLARQAYELLSSYRAFASEASRLKPPEERPEYAQGVPPVEPLFQLNLFLPAYERIADTLSEEEKNEIATIVASSLRPLQRFPEWGTHNRAMLRAANLALAARAFPEHPEASWWAKLADELAEESWARWSIEDAANYHPHWLRALFTYAEARERPGLPSFAQIYLPLRAAAQLLTPLGTIPDFGDSSWMMPSHWDWIACLEWGARTFRDPTMKWAAQRIWETFSRTFSPSIEIASKLIAAYQWCDETVPAWEPSTPLDALDDLVSKKIVFRTSWDPQATYACLNYRDEGAYGRISRDYLRTTLAVSAEKMHHGHADEGSIVSLISKGTVLLHDGGYREAPPDGMYRADIYHNRLVWRHGILPQGKLLEALHTDGRYHPTTTERLYWTHLGEAEISRVRIIDPEEDVHWERTLCFLPSHRADCFLVIDTFQVLRPGPWTFSTLWWTTDILAQGKDWYDTHIREIQGWRNSQTCTLLLAFPGAEEDELWVDHGRRHFQEETVIGRVWRGHLHASETISLVTILWAKSKEHSPEGFIQNVSLSPTEPPRQGTGILLQREGETILFGTPHDLTHSWLERDIRPRYNAQRGDIHYGPLTSDAHFVLSRRTGSLLWAGFINGTHLAYEGRTLYAGAPHAMFQEDRTSQPGVPARFRWEGQITLP